MSSDQVSIEKLKKGYQLKAETLVPRPRSEVFAFFSDAFQLENLTPPFLKFSVLTPKPIEMKPGILIDYQLKVRGIPMRWQSRISVWEPENRFVDEQIKGPYKYWHHEHLFEDHEEGTRIIDLVQYDVPLGFLVHPVFVKPDLQKIFGYRLKVIREVLG